MLDDGPGLFDVTAGKQMVSRFEEVMHASLLALWPHLKPPLPVFGRPLVRVAYLLVAALVVGSSFEF